jgi:hypothetical protein
MVLIVLSLYSFYLPICLPFYLTICTSYQGILRQQLEQGCTISYCTNYNYLIICNSSLFETVTTIANKAQNIRTVQRTTRHLERMLVLLTFTVLG